MLAVDVCANHGNVHTYVSQALHILTFVPKGSYPSHPHQTFVVTWLSYQEVEGTVVRFKETRLPKEGVQSACRHA